MVAASHEEILSVGGQNLHIKILGESGPAIVFEAGLGNNSSTWKFVAGPIAKFARVVLYDRAGLGQSLPVMSKNSAVLADQVAANLRKLLDTADIHPPYMLVGHSLGGLYVQMFARKYPSDVSGVVLLNSASTEAPSELKTRARLLSGIGGLSRGRGYCRKQRASQERRPVSRYASYGNCRDRPRTIFQGLGAHLDALAASAFYSFPSGHSDRRRGKRSRYSD